MPMAEYCKVVRTGTAGSDRSRLPPSEDKLSAHTRGFKHLFVCQCGFLSMPPPSWPVKDHLCGVLCKCRTDELIAQWNPVGPWILTGVVWIFSTCMLVPAFGQHSKISAWHVRFRPWKNVIGTLMLISICLADFLSTTTTILPMLEASHIATAISRQRDEVSIFAVGHKAASFGEKARSAAARRFCDSAGLPIWLD